MARNFDGVDDDIVVTGNSGLNLGTSQFTIAGWLNFNAIDSDGSRIIEHGADNIALSPQVYFASTTVLKLTFQIGSDFGGRVPHTTTLTAGTDYFFSVRRDASDLVEVDVWDVNLAKIGSTASATKTDDLSPASGNLNIGKDAAFPATTRWDGDLAHLWWIKARLNDNELKGIAFTSKPLTVNYRHWPLWGLDDPEPNLSKDGVGDDGAVTGAIRSNHPPITLFTPKWAATIPLLEIGTDADKNKRRSAITPLTHVLMPLPDGTIVAVDRQQAAWMYSGIAAAAPVVGGQPFYIRDSYSMPDFLGNQQS